ncbi:hypothetical protein PIROE2DRAFT_59377 [Piromyces sp. E2]|nr:hypothetical protein PIROE2DRAFT_59377 [Piromyces sp. E2]|eukprot:OUM66490.1 hypothetical protein PIROE2DRAFT_59377 [Piromyces sp. E2]
MFQRQNLYEDPNQYRNPNQAQSPMQSPSQPANSYTIDIAPTTYALVPDRQLGQPAPTPQPTYNGYQVPLSQQQSPISPLSYTTSPSVVSPSMVSPPPQSNYVYQAAPPKGLPNLCGGVQQAPLTTVPMPQAGLGMNYGQPPAVSTTPRFSIPPPSNGMMSPQQSMTSPPYSPAGYNTTYPNQPNMGQPLMSPQPAYSAPTQPTYAAQPSPQQPTYAAQPQQPQINYNQLNMY